MAINYSEEDIRLLKSMLSADEIQKRIDKFNETHDWSVFNDVPEQQHYAVLYPHKMEIHNILPEMKSTKIIGILENRIKELELSLKENSWENCDDDEEPDFNKRKEDHAEIKALKFAIETIKQNP